MKKILLTISLAGILSGCGPSYKDTSNDFLLPQDLNDCRVIQLEKSGMTSTKIFLIKCPEGYIPVVSSTYRVGKTKHNTTTIID